MIPKRGNSNSRNADMWLSRRHDCYIYRLSGHAVALRTYVSTVSVGCALHIMIMRPCSNIPSLKVANASVLSEAAVHLWDFLGR